MKSTRKFQDLVGVVRIVEVGMAMSSNHRDAALFSLPTGGHCFRIAVSELSRIAVGDKATVR